MAEDDVDQVGSDGEESPHEELDGRSGDSPRRHTNESIGFPRRVIPCAERSATQKPLRELTEECTLPLLISSTLSGWRQGKGEIAQSSRGAKQWRPRMPNKELSGRAPSWASAAFLLPAYRSRPRGGACFGAVCPRRSRGVAARIGQRSFYILYFINFR